MTELILTTPNQLRQIITECLAERQPEQQKPKEPTRIKGIHALAKFLNVSSVTAQAIKNSGKIPYSQFNRTIIFDGNEVLQAMQDNHINKKKGK